jgi:hypothetical protein
MQLASEPYKQPATQKEGAITEAASMMDLHAQICGPDRMVACCSNYNIHGQQQHMLHFCASTEQQQQQQQQQQQHQAGVCLPTAT